MTVPNPAPSSPARVVPRWPVTVAVLAATVMLAALLVVTLAAGSSWLAGHMVDRPARDDQGGMMWPAGPRGAMPGDAGVQPGQAGFVAGTVAVPRVVRITAGPGFAFTPAALTVVRGETITFVVTAIGPSVHEFMVGPADAVAGDLEGTPEIPAISMMESRSLTYTFDGDGPFAYACHAPGHYEGGMRGVLTVVPG